MKLGKLATFKMVIISFLPVQLEKVERIMKESKKDAGPDIVTEPFK